MEGTCRGNQKQESTVPAGKREGANDDGKESQRRAIVGAQSEEQTADVVKTQGGS